MERNNLYVLLIIQALISILILFSESTLKYATIAVYIVFDLIVLGSLLKRKWKSFELFTFATLFASGMYLVLLNGSMMTVIAIGVMLLFLISALLSFDYKKIPESLPMPAKPLETYEIGEKQVVKDKSLEKNAMMYELEREASELKRAEKYLQKKDIVSKENELIKEAEALEKASKKLSQIGQKQKLMDVEEQAKALVGADQRIKEVKTKQAQNELKKQAKRLKDADKKIREVQFLNKKQNIVKQAKRLKDAEKKIREVQLLNKRQDVIKQASELAKAQIKIDRIAKKTVEKSNPVFATFSGNNYHETGCMVIKKIPKSKLILFNTPKDAMKKGYKPCNV